MLNIPELEQRWMQYKIKSAIPYAIIVISLIVIITIIYFILQNKSQDDKIKSEPTTQLTETTISTNSTFQQNEPNTIQMPQQQSQNISKPSIEPINRAVSSSQTDEKLKLSPSMNFMKNMQNFAEPYYSSTPESTYEPKNTPQKAPKNSINQNSNTQIIEVEVPQEETLSDNEQIVNNKPKKIIIQRQNTQNDINAIIKRFKKNNNPALSLFIAKKYFEMGNYHQSYNYALITNQLNKEIEASWLIFAKSLVKLGKKEMAIRTLQEYVKSSHSGNAKLLLNEIRSGKFQ